MELKNDPVLLNHLGDTVWAHTALEQFAHVVKRQGPSLGRDRSYVKYDEGQSSRESRKKRPLQSNEGIGANLD